MKNLNISTILFSIKGTRLIWSILVVILLIIFGELVVVDSFLKFSPNIGLSEVTGTVAQNWAESIGDSIKRILRSGIVLLSIYLTVKYVVKKPNLYIGFDFKKSRLKELFIGISLGFLVQIISILLMSSMGWFEITDFSWNFNPTSFFAPAILYTIIICIETGITEEASFRGFLLNLIEQRYSKNTGVIISSVIFGLVHFSGFSNQFAWWMSIISSLATGFLFAQAFLLFRNLWLPFGLHAGWHLAMRFLGSVGLNPEESVFLITKVDGPIMLVSTKAGGAGLFELIGVVIAALIMYIIRKKGTKN